MKKMRILLVGLLLVAVLAVAASQTVWATPAQVTKPGVEMKNPAQAQSLVSSVLPPNCDGVKVLEAESKSVCGIAVLDGLSQADIFAFLDNMPEGYFSKIVNLQFTSGSGNLCFAAPKGGTIYFMALTAKDWSPMATFTNTDGDLRCATVSESGGYVLGPDPIK